MVNASFAEAPVTLSCWREAETPESTAVAGEGGRKSADLLGLEDGVDMMLVSNGSGRD